MLLGLSSRQRHTARTLKGKDLGLYNDLIDHLHSDIGSVAGGVIGILVLVAVSWHFDPDNFFLEMMGLVAFVGITRLAMIIYYRKKYQGRGKSYAIIRRWELIYTFGGVSFAFILGVFGVLVAADPKTQTIETLVIASVVGYAGGIAGRNAGRPLVAIGQVIAGCLPLFLYGLYAGTGESYGMAAMLLIYAATLAKIVLGLKRITAHAFAMQRDIGETNGKLDSAISHMKSGLCMMDADGRIQILNQRARELLRLPQADYAELHEVLIGALGAGTLRHSDVAAIQAGMKDRREIIITTSDPTQAVLNLKAAVTPSGGTVLSFDDITEQRRAAADIERMAKFDSLTGLANRATIMLSLGRAIADSEGDKAGGGAAVLLIDLDRFKEVNDTLGHDVGDKLLIMAADRLRSSAPGNATVGRLGGDEFVVIAPGIDQAAAELLAERVNKALARPMRLMGQICRTTASIGIALAREHGNDPSELMKAADIALYARKADGRNGHDVFDAEMARGLARRRRLEQDLAQAIRNGDMAIAFQPIVSSIGNHELIAFEALSRWTHPEFGPIAPDEFIPIAERTGLIKDLGRHVLLGACREAGNWPEHVKVSVNVSAVQLRDRERLFDDIWGALSATGLPGRRLDLEMTESVLVEDAAGVQNLLVALRKMDVSISLDDFGTGYSSLAYVQNYRFDKIKLDKAFARTIETDHTTRATIAALANIAAATGSKLLLEGVETEAQARIARDNGVHELQGWLFGRPMPAADIPSKFGGVTPKKSAA
jgi:diguanylate cyclase (GGDEF)-like protein